MRLTKSWSLIAAFLVTIGIASAACFVTAASAEDSYPNRPVRIIVPFGAGGSSDVVARLLAGPLQQKLGQPFIVENRPGAGANIGIGYVARSEPDGYTLMVLTSSYVINPSLYRKVPYNLVTDFVPIADLADAPNVLVANLSTGIDSLQALIANAKEHPDKFNCSTAGIGATTHLSLELLNQRAGLKITHVPYPGGGPAVQAVLSGTTQLFFSAMPNVHGYVKAGTMKALAITSNQRWPDLPDVPTFEQAGFPGFVITTFHIMLAPAGTPPAIVKRLTDATIEILKQPETTEKLLKLGFFVVAGGPDELGARIKREIPFYKDVISKANLKIE